MATACSRSGEQGVEVGRAGGTAGAAIDPNLVNPHTDEASFFVERAVLADLGVRAGFVWKKDSDGWQRLNAARRFENYNIPVSIVDPGPDGNAATTADNGPNLNLLNLDDVSSAGEPGDRDGSRVPGELQDHRDLGEQALRLALVDELVVLVHVDRRVR